MSAATVAATTSSSSRESAASMRRSLGPGMSAKSILQLTLAPLVADRTVERVVDEQELHSRALRADRARRLREDLHALGDRSRAGRQGLGSLLHFHQAHAAVGRYRQLVVVAEARHVSAIRVGDADDHLALARLRGHAVDLDVDEFVTHAARAPSCSVTMLRPA